MLPCARKNTPVKWYIVVFAIQAMMVWLYYSFSYCIYAKKRAELTQQVFLLKQEHAELTSYKNSTTQKADSLQSKDTRRWLSNFVSPSEQLNTRLTHLVQKNGIRVDEILFSDTEAFVAIKVEGSFNQVMSLLIDLLNSHLVFSFESIELLSKTAVIKIKMVTNQESHETEP